MNRREDAENQRREAAQSRVENEANLDNDEFVDEDLEALLAQAEQEEQNHHNNEALPEDLGALMAQADEDEMEAVGMLVSQQELESMVAAAQEGDSGPQVLPHQNRGQMTNTAELSGQNLSASRPIQSRDSMPPRPIQVTIQSSEPDTESRMHGSVVANEAGDGRHQSALPMRQNVSNEDASMPSHQEPSSNGIEPPSVATENPSTFGSPVMQLANPPAEASTIPSRSVDLPESTPSATNLAMEIEKMPTSSTTPSPGTAEGAIALCGSQPPKLSIAAGDNENVHVTTNSSIASKQHDKSESARADEVDGEDAGMDIDTAGQAPQETSDS